MGSKINNLTIISVTLLIIFGIVLIASIAKISDYHNEKLIYAMESKVEYAAKRCYLENNCSGEITLNNLYERKYLSEEVVNPITKEILNKDMKINFVNNKVVIDWN